MSTRLTRTRWVLAACAGILVAALGEPLAAAGDTPITALDWPTYGRDAHRTFSAPTHLDETSAKTLALAWYFPTGDAVTANPIVVGDTVYVGSWDGNFYAIRRSDGSMRWKFTIKPQPAVSPQPGSPTRDITSDGGLITSSAWYQPGAGGVPDLVIFGGGYTLYALKAATGELYWAHDYTGLPEAPPDPEHDSTRIFSSPAVVGHHVLFGVTADGLQGHRGYIVSANLLDGTPLWKFETDVNEAGTVRNDGCGGVWSSPTVNEALGLVVFGVADCGFRAPDPYGERVLALHIANGSLAWVFTPPRLAEGDPACDWDFGASANLGSPDAHGTPTFLGVGGKDGTYYRLDPATGALKWSTNVVFGGSAGGFIGTTAYDGHHVYGATALGDVGGLGGEAPVGCDPGNPRDVALQEPSLHAFGGTGGQVLWQQEQSQSLGPTTVAGGLTFVGTVLNKQIQIRRASTGVLVAALPLPATSNSGVVVSGDAIFFGTGGAEQGSPVGVYAYTPLGAPPVA